jgi:hypothetical protein
MITASADDLTMAPSANGGATMVTASADDLTDDLIMAPDAGGVCCARQQDAGEEADAQHNRARDGTTATGLGS